jgi:hypothetical protein
MLILFHVITLKILIYQLTFVILMEFQMNFIEKIKLIKDFVF